MDVQMNRLHRGFTLIEMVVVVAMIAVLAAIAYTNYKQYVIRGERAAAKVQLEQVAMYMERQFNAKQEYPSTVPSQFEYAPPDAAAAKARYKLSTTGAPAAFTVTAALTNGWTDPDCGDLSLDSSGTQGASGPKGKVECWQR